MIKSVKFSGELVAVVEQNVPADDRYLFPDRKVGLLVVGRVGARLGDRGVGFRLEVVDQDGVTLTTWRGKWTKSFFE